MSAEVHHEGKVYIQEYSKGIAKAKVKEVGKTKFTGTIITFKPDIEIFKEGVVFEWNRVITHLRQQAYLVQGLEVNILDLRKDMKNFLRKRHHLNF